MNDADFICISDQTLSAIAKRLESLDPDEVDYTTADGVVTVEFSDGAKFILSRQSATRQLWLAAGAHAWHYNWDEAKSAWIDDKDGHELVERLTEAIAEHLGHPIDAS